MDLEVCVLEAKGGDATALVNAMNAGGGGAALASCPGCRKVTTLTGIEKPGTALLLVEWDSVAAHEAAKATEGFKTFIGIAGPFLGGGSSVLHYHD